MKALRKAIEWLKPRGWVRSLPKDAAKGRSVCRRDAYAAGPTLHKLSSLTPTAVKVSAGFV